MLGSTAWGAYVSTALEGANAAKRAELVTYAASKWGVAA